MTLRSPATRRRACLRYGMPSVFHLPLPRLPGSPPSRSRSWCRSGAGGASDQMAPSIQGHHRRRDKLMGQPVIVVNKAGASGAEGLMDPKASQGRPRKLLVTSSALYTRADGQPCCRSTGAT